MIFFVGYYGFGNAGDEAILSATLAQFRTRRPGLRLVVASGNPAQTIAAHGVEAVAWNDMAAIHRAVQGTDLVVIGGGGLFHDYWGVDPDTFLSGRHWGVAYYAGPAVLATLYRKAVMLYAVGVGPLYSGRGIKFTRLIAESAHAITVRDRESQAVLEGIGVPASKIQVTADPAFAFEPGEAGSLQQEVNAGFELRKPVLAVAARHWNLGVHPDFWERELAGALDLFIQQTGGTVLLVPFQDLSGERENDRATAARILAQMRLQERAAIANGPATPERIYGCLRDCDVVLGMRLHALIFAATAGVPAVALSYDPKVDEIVKRLGIAKLDVKDLEAPDLVRELVAALGSGAGKAPLIDELREVALENVRIALELLDNPPAELGARLEGFDLLRRHTLEQENRALQVELADAAWRRQVIEGEKAALQDSLAEMEAAAAVVPAAVAGLEAKVAGLRDRLQFESERRRKAESLAEEHAAQIRELEQERVSVVAGLDRFGLLLQDQIAGYRAQRAWKVMLLFRKAYTLLLHRPKSAFLGWVLGLPFGRVGPLEEYELVFPSLAGYIPDTFRRSIAPGAAPRPVEPAGEAPSEPETPAQQNQYDVVILAIIDFDFRFQRPQQIAAELGRQGHRVFWISPTRFLPPSAPHPYEVVPLRENVWEIHLRSRQPDIYLGELKAEDVQAMSAALDQLFRDWTIAEHTVFVQLPFWRRLALELRSTYGSNLLYDCMDDWETFENMGAFNVSEEKHLVRECDVLVVTGAELERKFQAQGLQPVLARNGADFPFFAKARPNDLLAGVPRPIVGYFGAIADWIDLDLVYEVAKARPQYSFVLIGQVFGRDVSHLESLPNVRLLGNKPYADIPAYLYHFDACLIPFLINQVTKATDPVKLYEYFSLGKPVVATDMQELHQCGDLLYIGKDAAEFTLHLDQAVSEKDPALPQRRIAFARANTWTSRVEDIDRAIRQSAPLVSILVLTHNSAAFVRPCLESILRNTSYPSYEVVVVDNASSDDSVARVREFVERDSRVRLFALAENRGFAGGNNHAMQQSHGAYVVFLNIDTMVTGGWIGRLLRHLHRDSSIGLLCPVTNFAGNEVKINVSYRGWRDMEKFARSLAAGKSGQKIEIGVAPLYCAIMPRAVWDRVGEMDTRYEIGMFEDDDLSLRVRQAGFGVWAAEDCFIHHFGQGSFSKLPSETYNRIFEANRRRFEEKWQRPWVAHRTRPGVRPPWEEERFTPGEFFPAAATP